ncbi:MAG: heat-inducible transcriptional repressor HrcA [Ignavibacteria bacterium]|jgi:heat-inducible transcriptional repressor|nr:heat-inducible transcriptional repressor HrcA [Ignavibacteria bacterium]
MSQVLTNREKDILRYIVENFVKFGIPVGSRTISKQLGMALSSATIRNVMSDLEDNELIETPHTSAGRLPTDKGYRFYVDELMNRETLNKSEMEFIKSKIEDSKNTIMNSDDLYTATSELLSKISHQLAVVTQPFLSSGVFEKLEVFSIASTRLLVVITIKSGYVKTLLMEVETEPSMQKIDRITQMLNERLSGLTLLQIKDTFSDRMSDFRNDEPELLQMFIDSIEKINEEEFVGKKVHIAGTAEIITQPEFEDPKKFKSIINIAENKNLVIHIIQNPGVNSNEVSVSIGSEMNEKKLKDYSVICADYKIGSIKGKVGIIGPKRLNYAKMISLIEYTSKIISEYK